MSNHNDFMFNNNERIYDAAKRKGCLPKNVKNLTDFLPYITASAQCEDLVGFIKIFWYFLPIIAGDRIALKELAVDFCRQQYESKIFYSEPRYTPWEVLGDPQSEFSLSYDEVMSVILNGLKEGSQKYGIKIRSILSILCQWNGDNDERCGKTLELMKKYRYDSEKNKCGVVGIDIAGNEAHRMDKNVIFDKTFQRARRMGFHCTVHAGEASGPESVKHAIENMCAERIGHGYRSVEDENVFAMVKSKNQFVMHQMNEYQPLSMIHFECCPTSSVCTNAVKEYKRSDGKWTNHPMKRILNENIHFSISTDDPMVFQTDHAEEIDVCRNKLGMTWKQIGQCHIRAAEAAFIDDLKEKQELLDTITKRVNLWIAKQERMDIDRTELQYAKDRNLKSVLIGIAMTMSTYIIYKRTTR